MPTAPVSALLVTKNPEPAHLALTIRSLAKQERPPAEVLFIDSTPGGHAVNDTDCELCVREVRKAVESLRDQGTTVEFVHDEGAGLGEARRLGMDESSESAVWHLDEDSVIVSEDWTKRALSLLDNPDVAGVGGNVTPLRENPEGRMLGELDAVTRAQPGGWYIMYPKAYCEDGECVVRGQDRGEDRTTRAQLRQHGALVRDGDLLAKKDLPTERQRGVRNFLLSAAGGAAAGAVTSRVMDTLTNRGKQLL